MYFFVSSLGWITCSEGTEKLDGQKKAQLLKVAAHVTPSQLSGEGNQHTRRQRVTLPGHDISHSNTPSEKPCSPLIINITLRKHNIEHILEYLMAQQ